MRIHQLSGTLEQELSGWFAEQGLESTIPSVAYGVYDRTGLIFSHGVGAVEFGDGRPSADTVYRICSMTKSFCIAAVLKLAELGRLDLSNAVADYVPEFPTYLDDAGHPVAVTVQMLMQNSSGLPEDNRWADFHLDISREDLLGVLTAGLRFSFPPGEDYQYSNLGFAVLGLVVENVAGESFESFVERELITPLGLTNTRFDPAQLDHPASEQVAEGLTSFDGGTSWVQRPLMALGAFSCAGSLFSTVRDIARWSAWLSSGFGADPDDSVLSAASRRRMQRIHTPMVALGAAGGTQSSNFGYAMGLVVEHDPRFGAIAQHSGGMPGFASNMRWHCSSGIGVVVLCNTDGVPTATWSAALLNLVLSELQPAAREIVLWDETVNAARLIDDSLTRGVLPEFGTLFSPNVLSDVPLDIRGHRLAELLGSIGPLAESQGGIEERFRWARSPADLTWRVDGDAGALTCQIEMTETRPSQVQRLDIALRNDEGESILGLVRFQRPLLPPPDSAGDAQLNA